MKIEKNLIDPNIFPDENVLSEILGKGYSAYCNLIELYKKNNVEYEWKFYNDVKMWLCKITQKKKTIVWMSANKGFIRATIYIPEKHIDGIYKLAIDDETKEMIRNTENTGKSKGCTFAIRNKKVLKDFTEIMQYKMAIK